MKRRIRLTETDLHRVIKESVNKILTELDWKTYQSAAEKAYDRGWKAFYNHDYDNDEPGRKHEEERRYKQSEAFGKAAEKAFNRQYPRQKGRLTHDSLDVEGHISPSMTYKSPYIKFKNINSGDFNKFFDYEQIKDDHGRRAKSEDDIMNFGFGHSEYVKGKGWRN